MITSMLDISTKHLSQESIAWLNQFKNTGEGLAVIKKETGWFLTGVDPEFVSTAPQDLQNVVQFAVNNRAYYINFDIEANMIIENLTEDIVDRDETVWRLTGEEFENVILLVNPNASKEDITRLIELAKENFDIPDHSDWILHFINEHI